VILGLIAITLTVLGIFSYPNTESNDSHKQSHEQAPKQSAIVAGHGYEEIRLKGLNYTFQIKDVPGDGLCLFHSIRKALQDDARDTPQQEKEKTEQLVQEVIKEMKNTEKQKEKELKESIASLKEKLGEDLRQSWKSADSPLETLEKNRDLLESIPGKDKLDVLDKKTQIEKFSKEIENLKIRLGILARPRKQLPFPDVSIIAPDLEKVISREGKKRKRIVVVTNQMGGKFHITWPYWKNMAEGAEQELEELVGIYHTKGINEIGGHFRHWGNPIPPEFQRVITNA
jgi:hypothetical protein